MDRRASFLSSSSETSLVEEWETASSGASSPSGVERLEGPLADAGSEEAMQKLTGNTSPGHEVMGSPPTPDATAKDEEPSQEKATDEGGEKSAEFTGDDVITQPKEEDNEATGEGDEDLNEDDKKLKRRLGLSRFRLFQKQISTNLDESSGESDTEKIGTSADKGEEPTSGVAMTETLYACNEKDMEKIEAAKEVEKAEIEPAVTMKEVLYDHEKEPKEHREFIEEEIIATMKDSPFSVGSQGLPMSAEAKKLMSGSIEQIDDEISKRLSRLTGLLEDLSEMTGQKVKVDRDKVMTEVVSKVDPDFNIERSVSLVASIINAFLFQCEHSVVVKRLGKKPVL